MFERAPSFLFNGKPTLLSDHDFIPVATIVIPALDTYFSGRGARATISVVRRFLRQQLFIAHFVFATKEQETQRKPSRRKDSVGDLFCCLCSTTVAWRLLIGSLAYPKHSSLIRVVGPRLFRLPSPSWTWWTARKRRPTKHSR